MKYKLGFLKTMLIIILTISILIFYAKPVFANSLDLEITPSNLEFVITGDYQDTITKELLISSNSDEGFFQLEEGGNEYFKIVANPNSFFLKPNTQEKIILKISPIAKAPARSHVLNLFLQKQKPKNFAYIQSQILLEPSIKIPVIISVTDDALMTSKINMQSCNLEIESTLGSLFYKYLRITDTFENARIKCNIQNSGLFVAPIKTNLKVYQNNSLLLQRNFDRSNILPNFTYSISEIGLVKNNPALEALAITKNLFGLIRIELDLQNEVNGLVTRQSVYFLSLPFKLVLILVFCLFCLKQYLKTQTQSH